MICLNCLDYLSCLTELFNLIKFRSGETWKQMLTYNAILILPLSKIFWSLCSKIAFGFSSDIFLLHILVVMHSGYQLPNIKLHVTLCEPTVLTVSFAGTIHLSAGLDTILQHIFIRTYSNESRIYLVKS